MVRKSSSKKLQIFARVERCKIRSNHQIGLIDSVEKMVPENRLSLLYEAARKCFNLYAKSCSKLYLVPYSVTPNGRLEIRYGNQLVIHYAVLSTLALSMIHKLAVLYYQMFHQESGTIDFNTVMCVLGVLVYTVACGTSVSVLFQKEETACTVNTWDRVSDSELGESGHKGALSNVKAALIVIYLAGICFASGLGASIIGLVFADLPISYYSAAKYLGLMNASPVVPDILWKFAFWPLEFVTYTMPLLICGLSSMIGQVIPNVMIKQFNQLRNEKYDSLEDNLAVWTKYERTQVFHLVAGKYHKTLLFPTLFTVSAAIVMTSYVCIRDSGLPWWLFYFFLCISTTLFACTFWFSYQLVMVERASEEIVGNLSSIVERHLRSMSPKDRKYVARKAKVSRALGYRMGSICNFSLDVPVVMWEEILNQLLFLLSLQ